MTSPLPYINWRDGRPRFVPGPNMRKAGILGRDLRHDDGRWYTVEEARAFSDKVRREKKAPQKNGSYNVEAIRAEITAKGILWAAREIARLRKAKA